MKKLFYTAIVMITFSSVSMANTIELEPTFTNELSVEKQKNKTEAVLQLLEMSTTVSGNHETCYNERVSAYNDARFNGASHQDAQVIGYQAYFRCMSRVVSFEPIRP